MRTRLTAAFLTASLLAPLAALSAQQTVDGWRYATTITTDSGDGRAHVMTTRHIIAEGLVRTEFTSNDPALSSAAIRGSYMVLNAHDSTMLSVLPSQKMAMVMASPLLSGAPLELPTFAMQMAMSNPTDLGPDAAILGHPTRHYRTITAGTYDATMNGQTCTRTMNGTSESWVAADVDPLDMFVMELRAFGQGTEHLTDSLRQQVARAGGPKGFPLRSLRTELVADSAGNTRTITTAMEYTELEHGPIDRAVFEAPAGYRVMDMRKMPGIDPKQLEAAQKSRPNPLCHGAR